jgi:hypothetical protein
MVERFVLPERRSGSSQNPVCHSPGSTFDPSHDARHLGLGLEERMDVIWHDHPRVEVVLMADRLAVTESVGNYAGDAVVL